MGLRDEQKFFSVSGDIRLGSPAKKPDAQSRMIA